MSANIENVQFDINECLARLSRMLVCSELAKLLDAAKRPTVYFSYNYRITAHIDTRETLQVLMSVCPTWKKEYTDTAIHYTCSFLGHDIELIASDGALPGTCKIVETEETLDAVPARTIKVRKLQCNETVTG